MVTTTRIRPSLQGGLAQPWRKLMQSTLTTPPHTIMACLGMSLSGCENGTVRCPLGCVTNLRLLSCNGQCPLKRHAVRKIFSPISGLARLDQQRSHPAKKMIQSDQATGAVWMAMAGLFVPLVPERLVSTGDSTRVLTDTITGASCLRSRTRQGRLPRTFASEPVPGRSTTWISPTHMVPRIGFPRMCFPPGDSGSVRNLGLEPCSMTIFLPEPRQLTIWASPGSPWNDKFWSGSTTGNKVIFR
ncbi:hypothetical protein V8F06_008861 [Rhypophila decipiens]